jgi:hypothetical protein
LTVADCGLGIITNPNAERGEVHLFECGLGWFGQILVHALLKNDRAAVRSKFPDLLAQSFITGGENDGSSIKIINLNTLFRKEALDTIQGNSTATAQMLERGKTRDFLIK